MKKSEIITRFAPALETEMVRCYRSVLESAGRIQYGLYIWSDGEVMAREQIQGDNVTVRPGESETRELYPVLTVSVPYADVFDLAGMTRPEDAEEADAAESEAIEWLVDQYASEGASEQLESAIRDAEMEEY